MPVDLPRPLQQWESCLELRASGDPEIDMCPLRRNYEDQGLVPLPKAETEIGLILGLDCIREDLLDEGL